MFAVDVGLIKICWASSLDKINNFLIKTTSLKQIFSYHISDFTNYRNLKSSLFPLVAFIHATIWSELCFTKKKLTDAAAALCIHTHVKYDESIKMFNVTYSWEFSFYSPKGWIHFKQMTWRWQRKELKNVKIMISFVVFWF